MLITDKSKTNFLTSFLDASLMAVPKYLRIASHAQE
jgi:hypothetical protein